MNDSPLEFNKNRTTPRATEDKDEASQSPPDKRSRGNSRNIRDRRDTEKSHDSDSNLSGTQDVIPIQNGPGIGTSNMWAQPICGLWFSYIILFPYTAQKKKLISS